MKVLKRLAQNIKDSLYKENLEFEIFKLEESYRMFLKIAQNHKSVYWQEIVDFYSSFIYKVKNSYINNQLISDLELNVIKKTNKGWTHLNEIDFVPLTSINTLESEKQISLTTALINRGFQLIEGVGYVRLIRTGETYIPY